MATLLFATAAFAAFIVFIVGFSKRGINFIKYGFGQTALDPSLEKRFDELAENIACLDTKIAAIEINHFGHLKNYLGILNGVLLDKKIIDNETKARMDNELRGM
ncbi:MAG: hypothetical protein LBJ86_01325 [Spirochaetaceae bacterium]|jgi:hypothetical protein|nr:hypothetical protein [Spirochaetaceae bacterium]